MKVHRYQRIEDVPAGVLEFLAQDDMRNNVPYGIFKMIRDNPGIIPDYELFVVTDGAAIQLYAHHTPPYAPYLSLGRAEAVAALARDWRDSGKTLPGLMGPQEVTDVFLQHWPALHNHISFAERQGFYRLDQVSLPTPTGAVFEPARLSDLDLYVSWLKAFCLELNEPYPGDENARLQQLGRIKEGDLYSLSVNGQPVSMTVAGRKLIHGRCISFVYTPPEQRGLGYAGELVGRVSQKILDDGYQYCCLFTQLDNPVSNRIYQRLGYQLLCEFRRYAFG
ncbi:MAG TPA: GNAT family N-acetyltransferase [Oligoflexus sp.]|uniref:GNAT family N-acetyltransferase n=1 Tax=Oligoflexus sp. TaxID=1971216 RepID=UPI002D7EDB4F|nr:GNAT family N-acetyltransferase [Oligoflexus sp.]HET9235981.1 GNAT family N-acetyltransferase [Oligoflexus sp.]